jgi:osmotically-inducible protein OsmY
MAREDRERERRSFTEGRFDYGTDNDWDRDRYETGRYGEYPDFRGDPRDRRELEGGAGDEERAYRPFGDIGPTAYYGSPGYERSDRYDPYAQGVRYQSHGYERPSEDWRGGSRYASPPHERRAEEPRSFIDKTRDEVASWFGDREAQQRRHWDERRAESHRGRGPKDYRRSDERIREDVNDRLTEDPYLDATDITVAVEATDVTLTGQVTAREDKRRAERLAEQVAGVGDVQNNIRVRPNEAREVEAGLPTPGNF